MYYPSCIEPSTNSSRLSSSDNPNYWSEEKQCHYAVLNRKIDELYKEYGHRCLPYPQLVIIHVQSAFKWAVQVLSNL